jgi:hypothetical protein
MAYKKSIRGDDNQANEQFAHNRITIVMGGAGIMLVGFVIVLMSAAVVWMVVRNGGLLSILVVLTFVGCFLVAIIYGACFIVVQISTTIQRVQANKILSSVIVAGDVVAHHNGQEWTHLSSIHEQGKVMPLLPMKAESREPLPSEAYTVIDMHRQGVSFKKIAEATLWTEYKVRQLCNQIDGKGK